MKKTNSAGGIVMNARGEIALVRNGSQGAWWGFPKGTVDEGEEIIDAARREIHEETGINDLVLVRALPVYGRFRGGLDGGDDTSEFKTIHMFLFSTEQENLQPLDSWNPEARWVKKEDVETLLTHPKDAEFYRTVLPTLD